MPEQTRIVYPSFPYGFVRFEDGTKVKPPETWSLLEPGDAGLTRRVKSAGPTWTVKQKKGRRMISLGIWAPAETIARLKREREAEVATPEYQRRLEQGRARRAKGEEKYVEDFRAEIVKFLGFADAFAEVAQALADAVAAHATPVGSGTVARTKRIPIEERAEAAVIAWMRHQTTAYDHLHIARVKGRRREVRAMLAKESRARLRAYRKGEVIDPSRCPLQSALRKAGSLS